MGFDTGDYERRCDIVPFGVQVWLQEKFWPSVDGWLFGACALTLAVTTWAAVGYVLAIWVARQP